MYPGLDFRDRSNSLPASMAVMVDKLMSARATIIDRTF